VLLFKTKEQILIILCFKVILWELQSNFHSGQFSCELPNRPENLGSDTAHTISRTFLQSRTSCSCCLYGLGFRL